MGFTVYLILITIVCFLLILAIMVQNPKGGGLSSSFGGSQQIGGVQKTTDFLDKSTWYLGIALLVLIFLSSLSFTDENVNGSKIVDESQISIPKVETPAATTESKPANTSTPASNETATTKPAETEKK